MGRVEVSEAGRIDRVLAHALDADWRGVGEY